MTWTRQPIGSLASTVTKGTTPTTLGYKFSDSGIPFVRVQNLWDGRVDVGKDILYVDQQTHDALSRSKIQCGDLLLSIAGTIGRPAIVGEQGPLNCNQAVAIVRLDASVDRRYVLRWLGTRDARRQMSGRSVTGTITNLSLTQIKGLELPLPPLPEQKRIAGILDAADALRAKRRESLAQLDTLLQSTFLDMFGDPVTNPMRWEEAHLGGVGAVQGGLQVTSKRGSLVLERPYLRVANVHRGRLALDEIKSIRLTEAEGQRTRLEKDDLLIVEGHGNKNEIGRCARWDGSIEDCVHQNHLIRLRCDASRLVPVYAEHYLNSNGGRRGLLQTSRTTSGLNTISVSKVKSARITLPPLEPQRSFARFAAATSSQRKSQQAHLAELDTLFASLQSRVFRGEL